MRRKIAVIVLLVIAAAAAYGIYRYNQKPASVAAQKPAVLLTAQALVQAYAANEAAANKQYLGKTVEVTGIVQSVQPGVGISLIGDGAQNVSCTFEAGVAAELPAVGKSVTVRGVCTGYLIDVELNRCMEIK